MRNDDSALCLWAHDVWGGISRKSLEIETWVQRTTNRKWTIPSRMVTWPMMSRDPERLRSLPRYVWCPVSRKWLEIETWWQRSTYRKWPLGIEWSHDRWRHVTLKGQGRDHNMLRAQYLKNCWRQMLDDDRVPIGNSYPGNKWSCANDIAWRMLNSWWVVELWDEMCHWRIEMS